MSRVANIARFAVIAASLAVISALVAEYFGGPKDGIGTGIASYASSRAALAWL